MTGSSSFHRLWESLPGASRISHLQSQCFHSEEKSDPTPEPEVQADAPLEDLGPDLGHQKLESIAL